MRKKNTIDLDLLLPFGIIPRHLAMLKSDTTQYRWISLILYCSSYEFSQRPNYAEIQHNSGEDGWCAKEIWLNFTDGPTEHHYVDLKCLYKNYSWRFMKNRSRDIKFHHNYNFSFTNLLYYIILLHEVLTSF